MTRRIALRGLVAAGLLVAACSSSGGGELEFGSAPPEETVARSTGGAVATASGSSATPDLGADVTVTVNVAEPGGAISPLILGFSSALTAAELRDAGATINSWGGNPATRYNYMLGAAWNHGADYEFRNTNYGTSGDEARRFLNVSSEAGVASRVAVPTLGWVAKDDLESTCSFPDGVGGCLNRDDVGDCGSGGGPQADPERANVRSTPEQVATWIEGMLDDGMAIEYIAMDNEPELWGGQHYDVHPTCPTYEEILEKYLTYATAVREVAPDAKLAGPVMCCWFDYWRTAPGPADGSGTPFLEWFLTNVRAHDAEYGRRTLDVVDVHYYPQTGVYNEDTDDETNDRRLRSTRSLWDPEFREESWFAEPVAFIPRLKATIERTYPGTPLFISEWNFGADSSQNGALAIADVLGIYGREGVEAATYWRNPEVGSPGWFAFKMHGNYDDEGSRFGGVTLPTVSSDEGSLAAFAANDEVTGVTRVMLINKRPTDLAVALDVPGFVPSVARRFTYGPAEPDAIVTDDADGAAPLALPPSSVTVLELEPAG